MKLSKLKGILVVLTVLLSNLNSFGKGEYIRHYTIENGLTQNEITDILQDSDGFMWFATRGGLNRFDGYKFTTYNAKKDSPNGISNPSIECMYEDSSGRVWIGTKSGGVDVYDTKVGTFRNYNSGAASPVRLADDRIICITQDSEGAIWMGGWSKGITVYDTKKDSVYYLLDNSKVSVIKQWNKDSILIGAGNGVYVYDKIGKRLKLLDLSAGTFDVTDLVVDRRSNNIWITGWTKGLIKYSVDKKTSAQYDVEEKKNGSSTENNSTNGYSLMIDSNHDIWFGTWGKGLYRFNQESSRFSKIDIKPYGSGQRNTDYDVILKIEEDREGTVWVGTDGGGICQIEKQPLFKGISLTNNRGKGLKNYHILSILEDTTGILWVGTRHGGLFYSKNRTDFHEVKELYKRGREPEITPVAYGMKLVKSIFQDKYGNIWIGNDQGLYQIIKYNGHFYFEEGAFSAPRELNKISSIYSDGKRLFVGTQQHGLWVKNDYNNVNSEWKGFTPETNPVLKNERITLIKEDKKNRIWLGTYLGVYFYDALHQKITPVRMNEGNGLSSDIILTWCQFNDSTYFIGTPSGLNQLTEKSNGEFTVKKYYREDGLPNDYIDAVTPDGDGNLWISTNSGISSFHLRTRHWRNFEKSDGLQGVSFTEGCVFQAADGEIFFGGTNGFNYFRPEAIFENNVTPLTNITSFYVHNKPVLPEQKWGHHILIHEVINHARSITLNHKENEFSITFATTSYKAPERNQYVYRLASNGEEWKKSYGNHALYFSNLKSGDYIFEVKGSNNHGVWSEKPATLRITILPAPWKSKWAFGVYIILILTLVWLIRWIAVRQANLKHKLEVEKLEHEKENDIHKMKLQFFTNISHEIKTPLTLIVAPLEEIMCFTDIPRYVLQKLDVIYKNSKNLLNLVNQLLEFRKAETGMMKLYVSENDLVAFSKEVCYAFQYLAELNQMKINFKSQLNSLPVWFDRDKMELVLNNLISNAFKYSEEGGEIGVLVKEKSESAVIEVVDRGKGIPVGEIDKIFDRYYRSDNYVNQHVTGTGIGLALVKEIVELHRAQIEVESEPGKKTVFRIILKKGNAHFPTEFLVDKKKNPPKSILPGFVTTTENELPVNTLLSTKNVRGEEKKKLLIIEDNAAVRQYLFELFHRDYDVILAVDGLEGVDKVSTELPSIIISDIMMPRMDGLEFCKQIKSSEETAHIPIVFLTAKDAEGYRLKGIRLGADAYISKPFNPDELRLVVQNFVVGHDRYKEKYSKIVKLEPSDIEITLSDDRLLEHIIQVIEENMINPEFTAEILAKEVGMSKSTLYRKLKGLTGYSTIGFIRHIKIKRAQQLLIDPNITIQEVAEETGFNDLKYFRKIFKELTGKSPGAYRDQLGK